MIRASIAASRFVWIVATVTSGAPSAPTGTVVFKNGSTVLGLGTLVGGTAQLTTAKLPPGTNSLTATYNADTLNAKSTSSVVSQVVNQATINVGRGVNSASIGTVRFPRDRILNVIIFFLPPCSDSRHGRVAQLAEQLTLNQ